LTTPEVPFVVGENVTLSVQLDAAFSVPLHGLEPPPTAAKSPPAVHEMFCALAVLLVTVTVCAALVLPTAVDAKVSVAGETAIVILLAPESGMRCGAPFTPLSLIVMIPGSVPKMVGENFTLMVQEAPAARLWPAQLSVSE
jgi:hypothetical protein